MNLCTLREFDEDFAGCHLLHGVVSRWASLKPDAPALLNHDRRQEVNWAAFDAAATGLAAELLRMGFRKGDFLAASLPFLTEHVFLE
jgi:fatty-acyl-CoA synthase